MPRPQLHMGVGATVDVLVSKLHSKDVISKAYPNFTKNDKATGLIVLSQRPRQIRRQEKKVIIFRHDICGDQETPFECWAVERFVHIHLQGSEENFFPLIGGEVAVAGGQAGGDDEQQKPMVQRIRRHFVETSICWFVMIIRQSQMRSIIS